MDLEQALDEVLDAANQPKQHPPGVKPMLLTGEAFASAVDSNALKGRAWHDSLTPAQETVCRQSCGKAILCVLVPKAV
jgi:hypothetical protein